MIHFFFILFGLGLGFMNFSLISSSNETPHRNLIETANCPLNFNVLRKLVIDQRLTFLDVRTECLYMLDGIRLVQSEYLRTTGFFHPLRNSDEDCWNSFQVLVNEALPGFDVRSVCGFHTGLISEGCMNITTRSQFEGLIPISELVKVNHLCNQTLSDSSVCDLCVDSLSSLHASYLRGPDIGNVSDCSGYPLIYAGAVVNRFGPSDLATAKCLFNLDITSTNKRGKKRKVVLLGIVMGCVNGSIAAIVVIFFVWGWHMKQRRKRKRQINSCQAESGYVSGVETITRSGNLVEFTFDEIKGATENFSRENIIGMGNFGNVYKGRFLDGSEVAFKRLKNCSAAGDASFLHEIEVIASVRHVNLVTLRGYCTTTVPLEGHQRVIVCDLMRNGSLYDHLFRPGMKKKKLSWPIRQKIALGTARGLAYLHYGAQPAIIHRDIKASNILLDENFEPKLADFGLAKFTPEGLTHLSTKVAGTLGYVAPEYAMFGKLTERSDVYSFGVVLLELLSGKEALISTENEEDACLLTDWAWSLVRDGRTMEVIERGMPKLGKPEEMEKYVLVAILSSHPLLHARPTMEQIVNMLERDSPLPSVPDRPFPVLAKIEDITNEGTYYMCSPVDEQHNLKSDHPILDHMRN